MSMVYKTEVSHGSLTLQHCTFVILEKCHGFMKYFGFKKYKVFGCKDLCSFENHGIAKIVVFFGVYFRSLDAKYFLVWFNKILCFQKLLGVWIQQTL